MPSAFSHAIVGAAVWACLPRRQRSWRLLAACAVVPALPDIDGAGFFLGVPYASFWGHRGFVHSLFFGLIAGGALGLAWRKLKILSEPVWLAPLLFPVLWASHGLLDMATSGGLGVAIFAPFDNSRHFFAHTPIRVSPMSPKAFFGQRGIVVMTSEILWVWVPSLAVAGLIRIGQGIGLRSRD